MKATIVNKKTQEQETIDLKMAPRSKNRRFSAWPRRINFIPAEKQMIILLFKKSSEIMTAGMHGCMKNVQITELFLTTGLKCYKNIFPTILTLMNVAEHLFVVVPLNNFQRAIDNNRDEKHF